MPLFSSIKGGSFFSDIKGGSKLSDIKAVGSLSSNVAKVAKLVNRINQSSAQNQQQSQQQQQQPYQPYQTQQGYSQQPSTPGYIAGNAASTWAPASCQAFMTTGVTDSTSTTGDNADGNVSQGGWTSPPSYYPDPSSTTNDGADMAMATEANINAEGSAAADQEATSAIDESNEFTSDLNDNFYGQMAADEGCTLGDDNGAADVGVDDVDYDYDDGV